VNSGGWLLLSPPFPVFHNKLHLQVLWDFQEKKWLGMKILLLEFNEVSVGN
jgi:hypothetical protein